jgi:uncharacterized membrane protein
MKLTLALAALLSFSVAKQPETSTAVKAPTPETHLVKATRQGSFPTNVAWKIAYFKDLPMLSLNWPAISGALIGPIPVVFQGTTYMVNVNTTTYLLMGGVSITASTPYTMKIAGVDYYFYWDGSSGFCTITGHS